MRHLIRAVVRNTNGQTEEMVYDVLDYFDMEDYINALQYEDIIEVFLQNVEDQ